MLAETHPLFAITPGIPNTSARNASPRISKLRYWSNEAQAGESSTTGSRLGETSASRVAAATALSRVPSISCGSSLPSVLVKSSA
jgi:hypothetical protein